MNSNRIITWTLSCMIALLAFFAQSCDNISKESEKPVFPDTFDVNVNPGDTYTFSFTANCDWKVSVPTSAAPYFWIQDGSQKVYTVRGEAGDAAVDICVYDVPSFESHSVEISMTMGDETVVIGKLTIGTVEPEFGIRLSETDEAGFVTSGEGSEYQYSYVSASMDMENDIIELMWPEVVTGFMNQVLVTANFDWIVSEKPDWVDFTILNTVGSSSEVRLYSNAAKYSLEDQSGTVVFSNKDYPDIKYSCKVFMPGCKEMLRFKGKITKGSVLKFNEEGWFYSELISDYIQDGNADGTVTSASGLKFYVLAKGEDGTYGQADWVTVTDNWDGASSDVVQTRTFTVDAAGNEGAYREAILVALHAGVAVDDAMAILTSDKTAVKEEYSDYVIAAIQQSGNSGGNEFYLSTDPFDERLATFEDITDVDPATDEDVANYYDSIASGAKLYRLTYLSSGASQGSFYLNVNGTYSNTEIYPLGNEWLLTIEDPDTVYISMEGYGGVGQTGDKGSIRFMGADKSTLAIVICIRNY